MAAVQELTGCSLPKCSLNPLKWQQSTKTEIYIMDEEERARGTGWRDIKRRTVFSFRQICSHSPTHMDRLRESGKVNTFLALHEV